MNGIKTNKKPLPAQSTSISGFRSRAYGRRFPSSRAVSNGLNIRQINLLAGKIILAATFVFGVTGGYAAEYFVSSDGGHITPFENWGTAATNIQSALALANNGSTVWVSNGSYTVTQTLSILNTTMQGFGGERAAVVINGSGSVRPFLLNHASAMLRDLTITNGLAADVTWSGNGGGLYVNAGTVSNCLITGCESIEKGGGIYMTAGTSIACRVSGNTSGNIGGGLYINTAATVAGCEIMENSDSPGALQSAGGIYLYGGTLTNSLIAGNSSLNTGAYAAGGVSVNGWLSCLVAECVISNNTSLTRTGGIYAGPGTPLLKSTIIENSGGLYGGVYINSGATANNLVFECQIISNVSSNDTDADVAGLYIKGDKAYIRNCLISHNVAQNPAGKRATGGLMSSKDCTVESCTIVSNATLRSGLGTGGYYDGGVANHLVNCIVYGNKSGIGASYNNLYLGFLANTNRFLNNCTISQLYKYLPPSNITLPPGLVDYENGDAHLLEDSPCFNAGTNQIWMLGAVDLEGNPRLDARYRIVDIGCYERICLPPSGTCIMLK